MNRVVRFVRPKGRPIPLNVDDILNSNTARSVVERFNDLCYTGGSGGNLNWRGVEIIKNPCDLWMMVELFQRLRPCAVVETGTHQGGAALFYADILGLLGIDCAVATIDYNPKWSVDPAARGVRSLIGYSTDDKIVSQVRSIVAERRSQRDGHVMFTLDAGHSEDVVLKELELYSPLVTVGSYVIAEDTNVNGHPSFRNHGPGPWEAVEKFLTAHPDFVADRDCERFLLTYNPRGWLRRVRLDAASRQAGAT
jgi:cephalosporin hydroxylase